MNGTKYSECDCDPNKTCFNIVDVAAPLEAGTCILCNSRADMYAEIPVCGDWYGRGFVMRIGCGCDKAQEMPDADWRTSFETYAGAIKDWNENRNTQAYYDVCLNP